VGQAIVVTAKPGIRPGVVTFECNRSLTGMEIERYPAPPSESRRRPPDELARRLFALGATHVTIYSNVVTVEADPDVWPELEEQIIDTITNLFIYYRPGVLPPSLDAPGAAPVDEVAAPAPALGAPA
jgi:hypothetical protein